MLLGSIQQAVEKLHACSTKLVLYVAGGGSQVCCYCDLVCMFSIALALTRRWLKQKMRQWSPRARNSFQNFIYSDMQAIGALVSVPGASNTVLDARVPYANSATVDLLGSEPESMCSRTTAELLAKRAYERAAQLSSPGEPIIGIACTASLRTVRAPHL